MKFSWVGHGINILTTIKQNSLRSPKFTRHLSIALCSGKYLETKKKMVEKLSKMAIIFHPPQHCCCYTVAIDNSRFIIVFMIFQKNNLNYLLMANDWWILIIFRGWVKRSFLMELWTFWICWCRICIIFKRLVIAKHSPGKMKSIIDCAWKAGQTTQKWFHANIFVASAEKKKIEYFLSSISRIHVKWSIEYSA